MLEGGDALRELLEHECGGGVRRHQRIGRVGGGSGGRDNQRGWSKEEVAGDGLRFERRVGGTPV